MITIVQNRPSLKIILLSLGMLFIMLPEATLATTQFSDILYLDGQKYFLDSLPLEQYYGPGNPRPKFRAPNTATWRGYIATWEIDRNILYLKAIRAWTCRGELGLETLFPGRKSPIAATWFTGKLKVPQGKILKPAVPHPIYEKYLLITVEKGRVISQNVIGSFSETHQPGQ
jgi:hypothetical protein